MKNPNLYQEESTGLYHFLDEEKDSPLYYAVFRTLAHAYIAWGLWHKCR